jgi:hypothetical protein
MTKSFIIISKIFSNIAKVSLHTPSLLLSGTFAAHAVPTLNPKAAKAFQPVPPRY